MALHLIIIVSMIVLIIGLFIIGKATDIPILYPLAFLFLMFSGLFITISEGVILESRVANINPETLEMTYEDVVVGLDNPVVFTYTNLSFYLGLVLTIFSGFAWFMNPWEKQSPFNF